MPLQASVKFGQLLRQLRKRAGMTQADLAAAVGYSTSFISSLEQNSRLPDVDTMLQTFVPALGLQDEPHAAALLIESAALARGERPPSSLILRRETRLIISETHIDALTILPVSPTPLIGREQDLQLLSNRLLGHSGRLLTLVGPPGVGKTRLGLEVAARVQGVYKDGLAFVTLVAISDPDLIASALVTQLGLSENPTKPPQQILLEALRHKELLLVLDNFEQLLQHPNRRLTKKEGAREEGEVENGSVRLVAELLAACPGLHIIITSRERLHLRAEQRYHVSALEATHAVDLFVQCAQNANQDFQLTVQNQPIIAEICRQVDYLPLAIELTAARTDLFAPTTLLARLQQRRLDLLNSAPQDLPLRQRTLANAIGWSYNLLNSVQQQLLARLSVFRGGCTLTAARQVCDGAPDELDTLVEKNLLKAQPQPTGETRFVLLETIREFALLQLSAQDPNKRTQQRQAEYFLALAEEAQHNSQGALRQATLENLMQESENLRAALAYALAAQQPDLAFWLIKALVWFWYCQAIVSEGRERIQQALQTFAAAHDTELYADVVSAAGYLARVQGDWPSAGRFFQESMLIFQKLSRSQKFAATQSQYSEALLNTGAFEDALAQIEAATLSLKPWDQTAAAELAYALHVHGRILMQLQDYAQARTVYEESLALFRNSQSASGIAIVLYSLAQIDMREQVYAAAQTKYLESLALYEKLNNQLMIGANHFFLGYLARVHADYPQAMQHYDQGLQRFMQIGNIGSIVGSLTDIAKLAVTLQKYESAGILFGKAAQLRESIGETQWKALPAERAEYEQNLAALSHALGQLKFQQMWQVGASMALEKVLEVVLGLQAQIL